MSPPKKNTGPDSFNEIATLRIELQDTDPVICPSTVTPRLPYCASCKTLFSISSAI
jgi:hypothetical protein